MSANPETIAHARALCEAGDFDAAGELLRLLLAVEPDDREAWCLLARAELGAGRHEEAILAADRASAIDPASAYPHLIASLAALRLGQAEEAEQRARDAVQADPFEWRALALLAQLLARSRSTVPEAKELVQRIVRLAPEEPGVHLTAGQVAEAGGNRDAAKEAFLEALRLEPENSAAQHELARLRLRRRANSPTALAESAAGFARAVRSDPDAESSRLRLDLVLRVFLSKTAYLLLIDAYAVARIAASSSTPTARLVPVLLLAVPIGYAARFMARLTPSLRQKLRGIHATRGAMRSAATAEAFAILALLVAAVAPIGARSAFAAAAGLGALVGRVVLYTQVEHASRAIKGEKPRPVVSRGLLRVISVLLFLTAAALVVAAAKDKAGPSTLVGAAVFASGAFAVARVGSRSGQDA